jgi:hypothetical protein
MDAQHDRRRARTMSAPDDHAHVPADLGLDPEPALWARTRHGDNSWTCVGRIKLSCGLSADPGTAAGYRCGHGRRRRRRHGGAAANS